MGNRAGKDLKNVLNWMLPQRQNIQQAILEIKKENGDKTENKSENLRVERNQSGCSSPDIEIKAPLPLNESQNDTIPAHEVIVSGSDCPLCNKTFATKNNCRRHVREMHGMNPVSRSKFERAQSGSLQCQEMSSSPKNPESNRKTETCPICSISVTSKFEMRRHLVEHGYSLMDACSIAEKETPLSTGLPTLVGVSQNMFKKIPPPSKVFHTDLF